MEPENINLNAEDVYDYQMTGKANLLVQVTDEKVFDVLNAFNKYSTWNFAKVTLLDHGQLLVMMDFGRVPRQGKFVAPDDEGSPADNLLTGDIAFLTSVGDEENAVLQSIAEYSSWTAQISVLGDNRLLVTMDFNQVLGNALEGNVIAKES